MATVGYKAVKLCKEGQDWEAWDKAGRQYGIVELDISSDAQVVVPHKKEEFVDTPYLTKRRVDRAFIKNITDLQGNPISAEYFGRSDQMWDFIYVKGEYASITATERDGYDSMKEFNDNAKTCTPGIHYFETREGAIKLAIFWRDIHNMA